MTLLPNDQAAARRALFDDIEGFYKSHRRHSALDYSSPRARERSWTRAGLVA
jgi:transposase InsO family protein